MSGRGFFRRRHLFAAEKGKFTPVMISARMLHGKIVFAVKDAKQVKP